MLKEPYEGRASDCEMVLETMVQQIVDLAVAAGWNRKEAMAAIANVIHNEIYAEEEHERTNYRISEALGKVAH